ncbi:dihydrofolate reductase [Gramella sp. BOM4]|nr:dihydrofolate reductase [Christiangramia bathymodioli]
MSTSNRVFIATSIDGYIADADGKIDWLQSIPNPENIDLGYSDFLKGIEAIIMGRNTFETVLSFGIKWPYQLPVFVLTSSLKEIPEIVKTEKIELISGNLKQILAKLEHDGFHNIYVDGGRTIQAFINEDLIDEMVITIIPVILGAGIPLFSGIVNRLDFRCTETRIYLSQVVQNKFVRKRD